jgi:hypothetical protein
MEDSLVVNEQEDGSFTVEWDENDPKYSFLNDLTDDQVSAIIKQAILGVIDDESTLESYE